MCVLLFPQGPKWWEKSKEKKRTLGGEEILVGKTIGDQVSQTNRLLHSVRILSLRGGKGYRTKSSLLGNIICKSIHGGEKSFEGKGQEKSIWVMKEHTEHFGKNGGDLGFVERVTT